jgi:hypothetical protein
MSKATMMLRNLKMVEDKVSTKVKVDSLPNVNCRHCYGRGYSSKSVSSKTFDPCRCLFKKEARTKDLIDGKWVEVDDYGRVIVVDEEGTPVVTSYEFNKLTGGIKEI